MSEQHMRQRVIKALRGFDPISVENPCRPGTPDVNYVEGWLELKWAEDWPARATTKLEVDHYTPQQRLFHRMRWHAGGAVHLLLQVGQEWLLFDGPTAARVVGKATMAELREVALCHWQGREMEAELRGSLAR